MRSLRLDRLATLYLVSPLLKALPFRKRDSVAVLMYHHVSADPENDIWPYYRLNTSPLRFRTQMRLLRDEEYKVVDLRQAVHLLQANSLSRKHVVITFDDGFESVYTEAFPVLREYRFPATVFLPTRYIQRVRAAFNSKPTLTWREILEMQKSGISFGSHTETHPKLVNCSWPEIETEIRSSKAAIEDQLGQQTTAFAYPYAFPQENREFTARFEMVLKEAGYTCCVTTKIGKAYSEDGLFQMRRLPLNDCDDAKLFRAKLDGSYDWLGLFQKLSRRNRASPIEIQESCELPSLTGSPPEK